MPVPESVISSDYKMNRKLEQVPSENPGFMIGDVPILGDIILAPMAGFADVPTRKISLDFGSALQYTEFVAVEDIVNRRPENILELDRGSIVTPFVIQLFGNDAGMFLDAAMCLQKLEPDVIDINMGCSTRRVSGRGAGVGMMPNLDLIEETFRQLKAHTNLPITAKIRLGWDKLQNFLEVGRILENCGAAAITIHPRTKEQRYSGTARWEAIADLKSAVNIPVIGNGDIKHPEDIDHLLSATGCDAVMIGRGAIGNPWLLARRDKLTVQVIELTAVMRKHLRLMISYHGIRGLLLFRKHVKRYLADLGLLASFSKRLVTAKSAEIFIDILDEINQQFGDMPLRNLAEPVQTGSELQQVPGWTN